jgi:flagellar hook-associated protein 2
MVDQYMQLESMQRDNLVTQKSKLSDKKSIFSELNSKMKALKTKLEGLTDKVNDLFAAKKTNSSDEAKVKVTAESSAVNGNHTVTVSRLASSDRRVSNQYVKNATDFTGFTTDQTFTIEVGHPTDDDENNRETISVTIAASVFSESNEDVLNAIATAINDAMGGAVSDETIDGDEVIHASTVTEQSGITRLTLNSELTGYSYRMDFGASDLLDALDVNAEVQASGSAGGYMTAVGTSATDSMLNSSFNIDGLSFYRDSNTITDAYAGLTFKLLDTFAAPETVTIDTDAESVKTDVQEFISKYNEVVNFLRKNAKVDPDTHVRGVFSGDLIYSGVLSQMRGIVSDPVSGTSSEDYNLLYHIGIEASQDGTLSIKDTDKFTTAIEANYRYVADLFYSDDGVASRLMDYLDDFVKTSGTISASKKQIDLQTTSLNDRIKYMNEILAKKEKQYFDQFTKLQETMYQLQSQQSFFSSFFSSST